MRYRRDRGLGNGRDWGFLYFHGSNAPILTIWQHWFASDALGIITVAPLIIQLAWAARQPPSRRGLMEGIAALVALVILNGFVVFLPQGFWGPSSRLRYCFQCCFGWRPVAIRSLERRLPSLVHSQSF